MNPVTVGTASIFTPSQMIGVIFIVMGVVILAWLLYNIHKDKQDGKL